MTDTSIASGAFPPATAAEWRALVEKTLKDAPFESLQRTTLEGLPIAPLYGAAADGARFMPRPHDADRPLDLRAAVAHPDPARARTDLLADVIPKAEAGAEAFRMAGVVRRKQERASQSSGTWLRAALRIALLHRQIPAERDAVFGRIAPEAIRHAAVRADPHSAAVSLSRP